MRLGGAARFTHLRPAALTLARRYGKITEDKPQTVRNRYFESAHEVAEQNARTGGPLMGTLFWHWCGGGACAGRTRRWLTAALRRAGMMRAWAPASMAVRALAARPCRRRALTAPRPRAVHVSDSTWPLITKHTDFMNSLFDASRNLCPA